MARRGRIDGDYGVRLATVESGAGGAIAVGMTDLSEEVDGRRQRREHNRDAVIDALLELFGEGVYEPSSNEIAERAGLSPRSLFRYFDDVDDLYRTATGRQLRRARPFVDVGVGPESSTETKIERLVKARVRLFEEIGPAARVTRVCAHRHPVVAKELREGRAYLRRQLADLFAPELAASSGAAFPAIDAMCSFESYELLRHDQGLTRSKARSALTAALTALLNPTAAFR
jgi:TetR/AcrR family transcriptional regulator of autoinduction and epiphytic fitness